MKWRNNAARCEAMTDAPPAVDIPNEFVTFEYQLPYLFEALHGKGPVRIVAMGSSSTAGREDVVPYPHRLEMYLRVQYQSRFPELRIDVLNRGKGGEEASDELKRFERDIFVENPSLVIWQVGTNAVFHNYDIRDVAAKIGTGLEMLRSRQTDVLLIDPQYVTAMLGDDKADASDLMVSLIADAARTAKVNLFRRWALMRHWHVHNDVALSQVLDPTDPDKLHQNDWSTMLIAKALCTGITKAITAMA
jgi:hypothetical protein